MLLAKSLNALNRNVTAPALLACEEGGEVGRGTTKEGATCHLAVTCPPSLVQVKKILGSAQRREGVGYDHPVDGQSFQCARWVKRCQAAMYVWLPPLGPLFLLLFSPPLSTRSRGDREFQSGRLPSFNRLLRSLTRPEDPRGLSRPFESSTCQVVKPEIRRGARRTDIFGRGKITLFILRGQLFHTHCNNS